MLPQALAWRACPLQAFEGGRAGLMERLFPSLESVSAIMTGELVRCCVNESAFLLSLRLRSEPAT